MVTISKWRPVQRVTTGPSSVKRSRLLVATLLFITTLAVFSICLPNDFINIDDPGYVTTTPAVRSGLRWAGVIWALGNHLANWHPLTWLSHMIDCDVFGLRPWGHHLTSITLHAVNAVLLFLLLDRITGAFWRGLFVAALFALHPLHVESVAWVAERKDVLSTLFWMLTLLSYCTWAQRSASLAQPGLYLLSLFCFACGLMSKSMLVTTPFVLLLLDYWPLERFSESKRAALHLVLEKTPFFILAASSSLVTFLAQKRAGAVGSLTIFPIDARIENAFVSYCRYIGKLFVPRDLAVFYPHPGAWKVWQADSAILTIICISILALLIRRRYSPFFVGWFWYVGTLVPVIGIIQVGSQTMADRYTYFPSIGIFILVTWAIADISARVRVSPPLLWVTGGMIVAGCSILTARQLTYWRNSATLFQHAVDSGQDCSFVELYLGTGLGDQGHREEALAHLYRAEQLNPRDSDIRLLLGVALDKAGRVNEALSKVREAIQLSPDSVRANFYLGLLMEELGRPKEALIAYQDAVRNKQDVEFLRYNLGILLEKSGRVDEAITQYQGELSLNPNFPEGHNNLGKALLSQNRTAEAEREFRSALKLRPDFSEAHNNLGGAFYFQGRKTEAIAEFREALRLWPDYEDAKRNLETSLSDKGAK